MLLLMEGMSDGVYSQQYILHLQLEEAKHRKLSVAADPEGLRYVHFITWCAVSQLTCPSLLIVNN